MESEGYEMTGVTEEEYMEAMKMAEAKANMGLEHPEALLVLEKYKEWINLWFKHEDQPAISLDDFFKWGESFVIANTKLPDWQEKNLVVLSAGYGDDGGPATLYSVMEKSIDGGDWYIRVIIQEFDTNFSIIYRDGKLEVTPESQGYTSDEG